jgi:PAS domain S-box-containing protein
MPSASRANPRLEALLHRMTDRIRQSLELSEILSATATEVRAFLDTDRVKVYRFAPDDSGEVVAEAICAGRMPSLLGHRFPAEDIPPEARELFLTVRQRNIVNVVKQAIGVSPLIDAKTQQPADQALKFRPVDPCHVEYLLNMGVMSSLVVPVLHDHHLWGLLVAHHSQPRRFGPKELEIVQLVADQVSVALSHAMLLNQSRLRTRHEATINQVVTLLHKAPATSLQTALNHTVKALGGIGGRLFLNPSKTRAQGKLLLNGQQPLPLQPQFHRPEPSPGHRESQLYPERSLPQLEQFLAWRSWLRSEAPSKPGELLWAIDDLHQSQLPPPLRSVLEASDICGLLVAQLTYRNQHLGYLSIFRQAINVEFIWAGRLDSTDPRQHRPRQSFETWRELKQGQAQPWTEEEVELAQTLTHNFAQVIYQKQLYSQIQALNTELEGRVQRRTAELQKANTDLKREIEERENALRQLQLARDSLKRLSYQNELILKSAGEGICSLDVEGKIASANPTAARILGYSTQKMLGQLIHTLVEPTKADKTSYQWEQSPILKTLTEGITQQVSEDLFRRHNGEYFPVEYTSTSIRERDNILGAVVVFKDITERQMIERLKDEFISVVSHELRTPLTSIRTALGLLVQDSLTIEPNKRHRMLEIAFSNTNRLVRLVNDILDIERIKLGKVTLNKQLCDLAELINQAADEMRAMAEKHNIVLDVSPISVQLWVDPDRIIQTLANLLSNAIKFSPQGSTVKVMAEVLQTQRQDLDSLSSPGNSTQAESSTLKPSTPIEPSPSKTLLITVQDEGKGIPEDKLETIFDQFEQLQVLDNEHQGGTGLGLAICRNIVEQHEGRIWAESVINQGSTFFITLPIIDKPTSELSNNST